MLNTILALTLSATAQAPLVLPSDPTPAGYQRCMAQTNYAHNYGNTSWYSWVCPQIAGQASTCGWTGEALTCSNVKETYKVGGFVETFDNKGTVINLTQVGKDKFVCPNAAQYCGFDGYQDVCAETCPVVHGQSAASEGGGCSDTKGEINTWALVVLFAGLALCFRPRA